ncbi:hypothetical protein AK812_SmicGene39711 [Symbiodinium microadriaticum]|uniref:Uncharacterized protein n=1 Tax=Symbiodinium microadriaticum TaxID=2951 RepID=A0A1Q9CAJ1_SYMMI|nr:hypothetical protein AK812_SmicGene39711 [Symbiodinium microadriaticum]
MQPIPTVSVQATSPADLPLPEEATATPTKEAETVVAATALPPTQTLAEPAPEAALDSAMLSAQMELDMTIAAGVLNAGSFAP